MLFWPLLLSEADWKMELYDRNSARLPDNRPNTIVGALLESGSVANQSKSLSISIEARQVLVVRAEGQVRGTWPAEDIPHALRVFVAFVESDAGDGPGPIWGNFTPRVE